MKDSVYKILFTASLAVIFLHASITVLGESAPEGSVLSDSLLFTGEFYVITAEDLAAWNINTVEDILEMVPGVAFWRKGPEGAAVSFSVDGDLPRGMIFLINGLPYSDPYNNDPLLRFVPLSRLLRVEVVYGSIVLPSGIPAPGGAINIVIEEGGRKGPMAVADFTNGRLSRRSRRIWFSTPDSPVNLTFAYDEYLQDPSKSLVERESSFIGSYKSRSILTELLFKGEGKEHLFFRLQRFDDAYKGTRLIPIIPGSGNTGEDISYYGIDAHMRYTREDLSVLLRQRVVEMKRYCGWTSGQIIEGSLKWKADLGLLTLNPSLNAERATFENRLWGDYFHPEYTVVSGGVTATGRFLSLKFRSNINTGHHSTAGNWIAGAAGISREAENGTYQNINISRSIRMPVSEELFQPQLDYTVDGIFLGSEGNIGLDPEQVDEISAGFGFLGRVSVDLFARRERERILLARDNSRYQSSGRSDVTGIRSSINGDGKAFGIDLAARAGGEYFGKRSDFTYGIPEYRITGEIRIKRRFFKDTETLMLMLGGAIVGPRDWDGIELGRYTILNASFSMTVMSAIVKIEMRNLFDTQYQTVPGYLMPERHFRVGVIWKIFD
ncbi:MAG: TonB-dependent receptor plug domain-containing protein [Candidatus Krumholzibacteriota bacterium]|nr:TonB-dependent receptor plug domain-containing protein [Candidatus Krumholzibacteriota bacterium]